MSKASKRSALPTQAEGIEPSSVPVLVPTEVKRWRSSLKTIRRLWVCGATVVAVLVGTGVAHAEPVTTNPDSVVPTLDRIAAFVTEASQRFAIPSSWIRAVMRAESLGDVHALSSKGAMGLMQIMPETWAELRQRHGLGADPYDPHDNITAGAAYLRELHDRFGAQGFLAAYNAGPGRYEDHLMSGRPLPTETLSYVATVTSAIGLGTVDGVIGADAVGPTWTSAALFVQTATISDRSRPLAAAQKLSGSADTVARDRTALAPHSDGLFAKTPGGDRQR